MKKELEYIQKNFKDKINNKPKKLYKYKRFDSNTIDSIRNDYIWLSTELLLQKNNSLLLMFLLRILQTWLDSKQFNTLTVFLRK